MKDQGAAEDGTNSVAFTLRAADVGNMKSIEFGMVGTHGCGLHCAQCGRDS